MLLVIDFGKTGTYDWRSATLRDPGPQASHDLRSSCMAARPDPATGPAEGQSAKRSCISGPICMLGRIAPISVAAVLDVGRAGQPDQEGQPVRSRAAGRACSTNGVKARQTSSFANTATKRRQMVIQHRQRRCATLGNAPGTRTM